MKRMLHASEYFQNEEKILKALEAIRPLLQRRAQLEEEDPALIPFRAAEVKEASWDKRTEGPKKTKKTKKPEQPKEPTEMDLQIQKETSALRAVIPESLRIIPPSEKLPSEGKIPRKPSGAPGTFDNRSPSLSESRSTERGEFLLNKS
jgi:hypothetical protein